MELLHFINGKEEEEELILMKGGKIDSHEERLVSVAIKELRNVKYDYVVVNVEGRLDDVVNRLESIIDAEKCKVRPMIFET
ncbi:unnamed protein product [Eruca vesicaria subsp. sativa]|uniref:Uncharacterized protein n=1 Tax=Eruca vesicaria subsp. sativa TaxID=29727 RepID=A0ABC8JBD3_ERUVS|nr:unnamed protein product [Eruca vesicaria subsp. sativa]